MKPFRTEQEEFWAGDFGVEYTARNTGADNVAKRSAMLSKIFARAPGVDSLLELGSNTGANLRATQVLRPGCQMTAVEINEVAAQELSTIDNTRVVQGSILEQTPEKLGQYDLTLTSGVLIHIRPDCLADVYELLYQCSNTYVCMIEYYNTTPVELAYRGHSERLYKRDFAGDFLDRYTDVELVDYQFHYHRDPSFPLDDATWFLMRKK